MRYVLLAGRIIFAFIFITSGFNHLLGGGSEMASQAGIPLAELTVPFGGLLALIGGLSLAFGYKAKWGAWLIIAFLLPVTFAMHNFWAVQDPTMAMIQQVMFFKNFAIIGGAIFIAYFGSGPASAEDGIKNLEIPRYFDKKIKA